MQTTLSIFSVLVRRQSPDDVAIAMEAMFGLGSVIARDTLESPFGEGDANDAIITLKAAATVSAVEAELLDLYEAIDFSVTNISADAETPVADAETPVADAETPVADAKTPVADAETPVADAKTPPLDERLVAGFWAEITSGDSPPYWVDIINTFTDADIVAACEGHTVTTVRGVVRFVMPHNRRLAAERKVRAKAADKIEAAERASKQAEVAKKAPAKKAPAKKAPARAKKATARAKKATAATT